MLLFGSLFVGGVVVSIKNPHAWPGLVFSGLFFLLPQLWFAAFRLVLFEDRFTYRTLTRKGKEVFYSGITKAEIEVGFRRDWSLDGMYRLNIYDNARHADEPVVVNMKVFGLYDLHVFTNLLVEKAKSARIHKDLIHLSERGDLKPVQRRGAKLFWQAGMIILIVMFILSLLKMLLASPP